MINGMILMLILFISRSSMVMPLGVPLMVFIYININHINHFARASSHVSDL